MKGRKREIVICIITALATLAAVGLFFKTMEEEKTAMQIDLYTLIAPAPDAIITINRPALFAKTMLFKQSVYNLFASKIPVAFLSLLQEQTVLSSFILSFHPQGVIIYTKADNQQLQDIEKSLRKTLFNSFAPQKQKKGEITFTFYPDSGNHFLGYYQYNNVWVASYSKKLLEEVALQQATGKRSISVEQERLRKTFDPNAPLNIMLQADALNLYTTKSDSTIWRISDKWLTADLFTSEGNICYFGSLPYHEPIDTLYIPIADTLSKRLNDLFPQLNVTSQTRHNGTQMLYTGCSPIPEK